MVSTRLRTKVPNPKGIEFCPGKISYMKGMTGDFSKVEKGTDGRMIVKENFKSRANVFDKTKLNPNVVSQLTKSSTSRELEKRERNVHDYNATRSQFLQDRTNLFHHYIYSSDKLDKRMGLRIPVAQTFKIKWQIVFVLILLLSWRDLLVSGVDDIDFDYSRIPSNLKCVHCTDQSDGVCSEGDGEEQSCRFHPSLEVKSCIKFTACLSGVSCYEWRGCNNLAMQECFQAGGLPMKENTCDELNLNGKTAEGSAAFLCLLTLKHSSDLQFKSKSNNPASRRLDNRQRTMMEYYPDPDPETQTDTETVEYEYANNGSRGRHGEHGKKKKQKKKTKKQDSLDETGQVDFDYCSCDSDMCNRCGTHYASLKSLLILVAIYLNPL